MSKISDIFKSYSKALSQSREKYGELYANRVGNGSDFYKKFFNNLVVSYHETFNDGEKRLLLNRQVKEFFGTNQLNFIAIDGTCLKDPFSDFILFFGGAYGAKGRITLSGDPPKVKYEKWDVSKDVSLVAWAPVPFAELGDVKDKDARETFMVSDAEMESLSSVQVSLMQLAEIYLAYDSVTNSAAESPSLIMLDQSISGLMAAASHGARTNLIGYAHGYRTLSQPDVLVAYSHPMNFDLEVPGTKLMRRYTSIISQFHNRNTMSMKINELEVALGLTRKELLNPIGFLQRQKPPLCTYDSGSDSLNMNIDCRESWTYTVKLFQDICKRLFGEKDQTALMYNVPDEQDPTFARRRWMSPYDIQFLTSVGLAALVEKCWEKNIMLVGIAKDSESRYLTRNYIGVMKHQGIYQELKEVNIGLLPWTDRIFTESIPIYCDLQLEAPWATVEFDSVFLTLHMGRDGQDREMIMGVPTRKGEMVGPERLFLRSLAQFYLSRAKKTPLMGHVVFVDRLAFPVWDKAAYRDYIIDSPRVGKIKPMVYLDASKENIGQAIMMYLLNTLTKNHFPEVIGYPEPLHKAHWGAKTVARYVQGIIKSSEMPFRTKPIMRSLRVMRDQADNFDQTNGL